MSEQNHFVASDATVGQNHKPNRKEPKQISFRVSESEYLKFQPTALTLNMSVPAFVKKKAQGSRLIAPKFDKETRQSIVKDLSRLIDLLGVQYFHDWINHVLKTGHSAWRYLIVMFYLVPYILFSLLIYAILKAYE